LKLVKQILDQVETTISPLRGANWRIIFLSFVTAAIFWFFNALNKEYTARISYPVQVIYNKDSLVAVNDLPREIPVNVTGGGWQLLKKTISTNVDPIKITPKNPVQTYYLTSTNLLPAFSQELDGLNVNYVAIDTLFLDIEEIVKRKLVIDVDSMSIDLKKNFAIDSDVHIDPDTILFVGPSSMINSLPDRFIITLSEIGIDTDYDEELSMDLFSSSSIEKRPEVIRVQFAVAEFVEREEEFRIEPVNFPYDSSVYLTTDKVKARCLIKRNYSMDPNDLNFVIIADLSNEDPKDSTVLLEVIKREPLRKTGALDPIRELQLERDRIKLMYEQ